jgi:hypothetical protein
MFLYVVHCQETYWIPKTPLWKEEIILLGIYNMHKFLINVSVQMLTFYGKNSLIQNIRHFSCRP